MAFILISVVTKPVQSIFVVNKEYLTLMRLVNKVEISPLGTLLGIEELTTEQQATIQKSFEQIRKHSLSKGTYTSSAFPVYIGSGALYTIITLNSKTGHDKITPLIEQLASKNSVVDTWLKANKLKDGAILVGINASSLYPIISYLKRVETNSSYPSIVSDKFQQIELLQDAQLQLELGEYYVQQGLFEKALVHLSDAVELSANPKLSDQAIQLKIRSQINLGLNCQAVKLAQQLVDTSPSAISYHWLSRAYRFGQCADQEASLKAALLAHELDPNHFWFAFDASYILMDLGRLDEARKLVEHGVKRAPEHFETSFVQGRLALLEKNYPSATYHFQDAIEKEPSVANHWIFLSKALYLAGNDIRAMETICQGRLVETDRPITSPLFPDLDCDSQ